MCEIVVEFGRQGMGRAEIAAGLDVSRQTLATWEKTHPEFLDATTRAKDLAAGWWAEQGRTGIRDRNFNAHAYRLQVLNRFPEDWRDKQTHEHAGPDGNPLRIVVERDG
jgi:hypothetical protein